MKYLALIFCLLVFQSLYAQTDSVNAQKEIQTAPAVTKAPVRTSAPVTVPEDKSLTLQERFLMMKSKSQTFNDYKVIKETVLDGVWKITRDSISTRKTSLAKARATIASLESEVTASKAALQQKEASMQEVVYDSTHITVLGISFGKQLFLGIVASIIALLVLGLLLATGKLKLMYTSIKEKAELVNVITTEYEEYKRKALDKQTKLSRELQNERNKLAEIRR